MSTLTDRINKLSEEVEDFPLSKCSPSDDPDMQTAYLYSFKDLAKRFVASLKRLDDSRLLKILELILLCSSSLRYFQLTFLHQLLLLFLQLKIYIHSFLE